MTIIEWRRAINLVLIESKKKKWRLGERMNDAR